MQKLKADLEEEGFHVVYFESSQILEMADVDVTDIMLAIAQSVSKSLEAAQIRLRPGYFVSLFRELTDILQTDVKIDSLELSVGIAKITTKTKDSPKLRSLSRQYLEPRTNQILTAINQELLLPAQEQLKGRGKKGLVAIVDNLDRLDNTVKPSGHIQPEYLFVERGEQLKQLNCHVVYIIPLLLRFTNTSGRLSDRFNGDLKVLPMIPVQLRQGGECKEGMELLQKMVLKRAFPDLNPVQKIDLIDQIFDSPDTLSRLCRVSGGHVRNLLNLVSNDEVLRKFLRLVPDFASWATTIEFELTTDELRDLLRQKIENIFAKEEKINIQDSWEFNRACLDWQQRGETLEAELDASWEFIRGNEDFAKDNIDEALTHYRHSHQFWEKVQNLERQGILLVNIARCYDRKAEQNRRQPHDYWQESWGYLQCGIELFESAQRWDLLPRYISQFCTVLRRLENWKELEIWARKALNLCQNQKPVVANNSRDQLSVESQGDIPNASPPKQAQYYGFLAEAALGRSDYTNAKRLARQTLEILEAIPNCPSYEKCLSLFILAQSEWHFGQKIQAISHLEQVREECSPPDDPELYIKSLEELRSIYFEEGEYQKAFEIKQEIRAIEYQYRFKSFVGAGLLPPQPKSYVDFNQEQINREIAPAGRGGDVKKLLERISSTNKKLIVIHGNSGVGKSSLLTAGLIPALQRNPIEGRDVLPVLVRVYSNWVGELEKVLKEALQEMARIIDPPQPPLISRAVSFSHQKFKSKSDRSLLK